MGISIRLSGMDVRDSISWIAGSGFPKSHNIGKSTGDPKWDGWGTALKPSVEPISLARKPLSEKTVAANTLTWLGSHGYEHLANDALVVLTDKDEVSNRVHKDVIRDRPHLHPWRRSEVRLRWEQDLPAIKGSQPMAERKIPRERHAGRGHSADCGRAVWWCVAFLQGCGA